MREKDKLKVRQAIKTGNKDIIAEAYKWYFNKYVDTSVNIEYYVDTLGDLDENYTNTSYDKFISGQGGRQFKSDRAYARAKSPRKSRVYESYLH